MSAEAKQHDGASPLVGGNNEADVYQSRVMDLIKYSLSFYLEELVLWNNPTVTFRHPANTQFGHLNDIVIQALTLYDHPAKDSFWGFSGRLESDLIDFQQYEGYVIDYADTGVKENHVSATQLKAAINQIKIASVAEVEDFIIEHPDPIDARGKLLNLSNDVPNLEHDSYLGTPETKAELALLIDSLFELEEVPHELIGRVNSRIEALENSNSTEEYRKYQQLDPVVHLIQKITLADESELQAPEPEPTPAPKTSAKRRKKSKSGSFNERVIELLEENNHLMAKYNDRFDQMHSDISQLKVSSEEADRELQKQIDEIREAVERPSISETPPLHAPTTLIFDRNSTQLSSIQRAQINLVLPELIKNTSEKIMVTGYADALGNREYNILLSKKRALSVSRYLSERGIDSSRMTVNYVGAEDSQSTNPLDRKVVIEWINQ